MAKSTKSFVLACPFCGAPPMTMPSGEQDQGLMIHCVTDGCVSPSVSYYDHKTALLVWNKRRHGAGKAIEH